MHPLDVCQLFEVSYISHHTKNASDRFPDMNRYATTLHTLNSLGKQHPDSQMSLEVSSCHVFHERFLCQSHDHLLDRRDPQSISQLVPYHRFLMELRFTGTILYCAVTMTVSRAVEVLVGHMDVMRLSWADKVFVLGGRSPSTLSLYTLHTHHMWFPESCIHENVIARLFAQWSRPTPWQSFPPGRVLIGLINEITYLKNCIDGWWPSFSPLRRGSSHVGHIGFILIRSCWHEVR